MGGLRWSVDNLGGLRKSVDQKWEPKLEDPNFHLNCEQVFSSVILWFAVQQVAKVGAEHCVSPALGKLCLVRKHEYSVFRISTCQILVLKSPGPPQQRSQNHLLGRST